MTRAMLGAVAIFCACALMIGTAEARPRQQVETCDNNGRCFGETVTPAVSKSRRRVLREDAVDLPAPRSSSESVESRVERSALVATINAKLARWVRPTGKCGIGQTETLATYYNSGAHTATGARFNPMGITAAHRTLAFGTRLNITNPHNGRSTTVIINDRGPYTNAKIDLAQGAAMAIGMHTSIYLCISGASWADALQ